MIAVEGFRGIVEYPEWFLDVARIIGRRRYKNCCDRMPSANKRGENALSHSIDGALGELIGRKWADDNPCDSDWDPFDSDDTIPRPDGSINGETFDIKTTDARWHKIMVRASQHRNKMVSFYWFFVLIQNNRAMSFIYNYQTVGSWPINERLPLPAHSFDISEYLK